ncbi:hypothetical protein [Bacillus sp. FJAT-18017]|uniref:hypothetical protein n=1 Tax=Bacillus sp. FJAT-18017 TaxID=1705566 RepID=UPI000B176315|nr:hypothetical protein [Bacillus sp. FJAT-18017]
MMDFTKEMVLELENMIRNDEVEAGLVNEIIDGLRNGTKSLEDFYTASAPHRLLEVLDEVSERIKR